MHIPRSLIAEGIELLSQDENDVLTRLGSELYSRERQEAGQALAGRVSPQDLQKKAKEYLDNKREALRGAICPEWKEKKREDFTDTSKILVVLIGVVAEALKLTQSYLNLAMVVSVIILKRGISKFCE